MNGFIASANTAATAAKVPNDRQRVMEYFPAGSLPVLFDVGPAICGLQFLAFLIACHWPDVAEPLFHPCRDFGRPLLILRALAQFFGGFSFSNGTIYERLKQAGKYLRIFHDVTPQYIGFYILRAEYLNPL